MPARYERKFVATELTGEGAVSLVKQHPALFREAYPPRLVTSVYLDTPSLSDYHAHVGGAGRRSKTRVRWYGAQREVIEAPFLERKVKAGPVGDKESFALGRLCLPSLYGTHALRRSLESADLPGLLRAALALRQPSAANRYRRRYFESADRRFRITVDEAFEVLRVQPVFRPAERGLRSSRLVIVELKFAPADAEDGADIAAHLPFRLAQFSKYLASIEAAAV
jgi:hypothetical protein